MSQYHVRPLNLPEDYARMADLFNTIGNEPVTVAELTERDSKIPTPGPVKYNEAGKLVSHCRDRLVATDESGYVVAYADVWRAPWTPPGKMITSVVVDPAYQSQGVGRLLAEATEAIAREKRAEVLIATARDHNPAWVAWAEKRGFTVERHMFESSLDLATFDETPFAGVIERVEASGIRFFTLADEPGEAAERKFYELDTAVTPDIPGEEDFTPMPYSEFRKWVFETEKYRPDLACCAGVGDRMVGISAMHLQPETGSMYTITTAVDREFRGRSLALALKLLTIRAAKRYSAPYMRTNNDSMNGPMLAVNRKLGYQPLPGFYRLIKSLI